MNYFLAPRITGTNSSGGHNLVKFAMSDSQTRWRGERRIRTGAVPEALGESESFLDFQERLSRVSGIERPVLIVGERGTGKELAASRLHYLSQRWDGPFVELNCAALAPALLESELFGHEAGSFTGAARRRQGRFEAASGGTLFLDEIGLIPIEVQEKILRVVEYHRFERVGGSEPVEVDVRIIGATNNDLPTLCQSGEFKRDLLDRLSFEVLFLPPLRVRRGDILLLARHFAARMAMELGWKETPEFSEAAEAALQAHSWPGNIRELKNVVERAVYRTGDPRITEIDFDPFASPFQTVDEAASDEPKRSSARRFADDARTLPEVVREVELDALQTALRETRFHQGEAAKRLGLSYHQFRGLYRKYREELQE